MRLSECIFHLQECAAASREHVATQPVEEGTAQIMITQAIAFEMAAEKLSKMLPKNERDELQSRGKAN